MENLISKWKKLINNERKEGSVEKDNNLIASTSSLRENKFKKSNHSKHLSSSMSDHRENHFQRSSSSSSQKAPIINKLHNDAVFNDDQSNDKIMKLILKSISYIEKNQDHLNIGKLLEMINEYLDFYVEFINSNKLILKKFDEKEMIMKTKCDAADKIIKDYELKFLTSEKERVLIFLN
jgi:hypothetical protein